MTAPTNRQPHIQGLRAVAVLLVIAYHAGLPVHGGFIGVDVFFVISGYVITAMLLRELDGSGRVRFGRFYLRRFKRLTPALALTVTATVLASAFILSPLGPQQHAARTGIGAMLLAANAVIASTTGGYFDAPAAINPLLNIWSLSVEEQFYLGFPALMALAWWWAARRRQPSHVRIGIALATLLSFALALYGSAHGPNPGFWLGFYSPLTRAWEFGAGALLALSPQPRWSRQGAIVTSSFGAGLLAFGLMEIDTATPFPSIFTLLPVLGTVALISAASRRHNLIADVLASRPFVAIGDWSYSLYLWHWPVIVLAGVLAPQQPNVAVIAAAASVLPALLSYRFVEQPIRSRDYQPRAFAVLIAATVLTPILAAVGVLYVADHVWKPRASSAAVAADARAMHAGYVQGCHFEPGDGTTDPKPCQWNAERSGTPVYLLGDSNAAQFAEALIDATASANRPLTATTTSGCPLLDIRMDGPDFPGYGATCLARNLRLLDWLGGVTPGTVVLAASNDYWFDPGWSVRVDGAAVTDHAAMVDAMQASLRRVVQRLQQHGHRVVLVQTIPHWVGKYVWDPARCTLTSALQGCVQTMPATYARSRTAEVRAALRSVGSATGARVIDVTPQVCPDDVCRTVRGSLPVYRDATHITVAMSHTLAPTFADAIRF